MLGEANLALREICLKMGQSLVEFNLVFPSFQSAYGLPVWKSISWPGCRTHPWRQPGISEAAFSRDRDSRQKKEGTTFAMRRKQTWRWGRADRKTGQYGCQIAASSPCRMRAL